MEFNPLRGLRGSYTPKRGKNWVINKRNPSKNFKPGSGCFPGQAGFSSHGSYTPKRGWSGVYGKK